MTERVREIVAEILDLPLEAVPVDAQRETIERWDSMQNLNIMIALEQELDVSFDPAEMEQMTSVVAIAALLSAKQIGK